MKYRIETDSIGEINVPVEKLWGAQTQRSIQNFDISNRKFPTLFIKALIEVKRACAIANWEVGELPEAIAEPIIKASEEILDEGLYLDMFPLDIFQTGSGTQTNMNANEVLANRALEIMGREVGSKDPIHPNDHVNRGQSSNDVIPTALHISTLVALKKRLIPAIISLEDALKQKSMEFESIIKIGRTHLQDAVPCTLGQEFMGYVFQLEQSRISIENSFTQLRLLALGGTAVGTGLNAHPKMAKCAIQIISKRTSVQFSAEGNRFGLLAGKEALVITSGALKSLAVTLIKIANDIRFLASGPRAGLGELILEANEPGSSIMPGKINPTQCEMIVQVSAQVIGNDTVITQGGIQGYFELNLMKPVIASNILESIDILTRAISSFTRNCVQGIKANTKRLSELVEQSLMLVTALTTYTDSEGKLPYSYDEAAKVAKEAYNTNVTIREILQKDGILSDEQISEALNLSKMVKPHE